MTNDTGDARRFLQVGGPFEIVRGTITSPTIAYETWGELNGRADNAVLVFTGMSLPAHAASSPADPSDGWWEGMIGAGKAIDTDRFFVICVNSLESCFGTTGPASVDPETGEKYRLAFPVLCLEDIAKATYLVVRHLEIEKLHTLVGSRAIDLFDATSHGSSIRAVLAAAGIRRAPLCQDE